MYFKKLENNVPVGNLIVEDNLKFILDLNFDNVISVDEYRAQGFAVFNRVDMPYINYDEECVEGNPIFNEDGTYTQTWVVKKLPAEVVAEKRAQKQLEVDAYKQRLLAIYEEQLKNPAETADGIAEINRWKAATIATDTSDPFNVQWPTEESVNNL